MQRLRRLLGARWQIVAGVAAIGALAAAPLAFASAPTPTLGTATVDGDPGEWSIPGDSFSDMLRAGGNGGQTTVESKLYLRYDCATKIMYALVLAEPGVTIASDSGSAGDNFVKLGVKKQVDASFGDDGTAPDFAYVGSDGTTATGWEASFPLAEGTYTDLNVHTQVNDGGSQTSAVPGRAITVSVSCGEIPLPRPLTVTTSASATFDRAFDWSIAKEATPPSITTAADTATFSYKVTVTKSAPVDSNFAVSGTITVSNPNPFEVGPVSVTDEVAPSTECALANATDLMIGGDQSVQIPYSCPLASKTDGKNQATATWPQGSASGQAPYAFGDPTSVTNATVDVTDAFGADAAALLAGGDDLADSAVFTYTRDVTVPATGCLTFPNIATITSPNELVKTASAQVEACRTAVTIAGQPTPTPAVNAALRITKRGPARATAGQVVKYTIVVRNTSTSDATSVVLSDVLPGGYSVYKIPVGASMKKGKLVWNVGNLAAGASKTVRVQVRIARTASGTRCNTALASAGNAASVKARACTKVAKVAGAARIPVVTG